MVLGDSLSAGFGIDVDHGWVNLLQQRIDDRGFDWRVVNASISGDTTRGALARLPRAIQRHQPDAVIVELGGNDGLRGLSLQEMSDNLAAIVERLHEHDIEVLMLGMRLPPNFGPAYTSAFHSVYERLASEYNLCWVPFFLQDVANDPSLMQGDGFHPNAAAQPLLLEAVWPEVRALLHDPGAGAAPCGQNVTGLTAQSGGNGNP